MSNKFSSFIEEMIDDTVKGDVIEYLVEYFFDYTNEECPGLQEQSNVDIYGNGFCTWECPKGDYDKYKCFTQHIIYCVKVSKGY